MPPSSQRAALLRIQPRGGQLEDVANPGPEIGPVIVAVDPKLGLETQFLVRRNGPVCTEFHTVLVPNALLLHDLLLTAYYQHFRNTDL